MAFLLNLKSPQVFNSSAEKIQDRHTQKNNEPRPINLMVMYYKHVL